MHVKKFFKKRQVKKYKMISFCSPGLMTLKSHESGEIRCKTLFIVSKYSASSPGTDGCNWGVKGSSPVICYSDMVYRLNEYLWRFLTEESDSLCGTVLRRVWLFVTPWTVAHQTPLSLGFSSQECWSGLPSPPPGNLPDPGIEPGVSCIAGGFFTIWTPRVGGR